MDVDKLVARYPFVYHMAEAGTWESIRRHGLLSTSAILDLAGYEGRARSALEVDHRPEKVAVTAEGLGSFTLRDQKPMDPSRLTKALKAGSSPSEWYRLLNGKVFFWVEEGRLLRLLRARHYRRLEHDVLTLDTQSIVAEQQAAISLCHMNSGNTFPIPHFRGPEIFKRIDDYPAKVNGRPTKEVVELVVDHSVRNIDRHVVRVRRMHGEKVLGLVWSR